MTTSDDEGQGDEQLASFPGVELRISLDGKPIVLADSVRLHFIAKYAGVDSDSWHELLGGMLGHAEGLVGLAAVHLCERCKTEPTRISIEVRPVMTSLPSDDES